VVYDFVNEALSEIEVEFGFLLHKHFHITFMHLFTFNLQELAKIRLSSSAHSLDLALCEGVQDGLDIRVDVVNQVICLGLFNVINGALEYEGIRQVLQA